MKATKQFPEKPFTLFFLILIFFFAGCSKNLQKETTIYKNDFEHDDLRDITNGKLFTFNGSKVLGRYSSEAFRISLDELPSHDLVKISFELNIHDSWDGNAPGIGGLDGPDFWRMSVDGTQYINTTFSNTDCNDVFCSPQSYPNGYLVQNNPRSDAYRTDLPGVCQFKDRPQGSNTYKIVRTVEHTKGSLMLECLADLKGPGDQLCDESWSVDNVEIKAIQLRY